MIVSFIKVDSDEGGNIFNQTSHKTSRNNHIFVCVIITFILKRFIHRVYHLTRSLFNWRRMWCWSAFKHRLIRKTHWLHLEHFGSGISNESMHVNVNRSQEVANANEFKRMHPTFFVGSIVLGWDHIVSCKFRKWVHFLLCWLFRWLVSVNTEHWWCGRFNCFTELVKNHSPCVCGTPFH